MPSQRNINQLSALKDKFSRAKSVVFADHSGMSVPDTQALRQGVKDAGGEMTVAKNTLLKLALEQGPRAKGQGLRELAGPTSVLFAYQDEILPIKVLAKFAADHDKPLIKAGLLGSESLTAEQIKELASLPGFNELLVKFMGQMQGPAYGLVGVLQGNIRKLVLVLKAISSKN